MKTPAQKARRRRYELLHSEKHLAYLKRWIAKETNPNELKRAKEVLARHEKRFADWNETNIEEK